MVPSPVIASFAILGVGGAVQSVLLFWIFTHPAGGWEVNPFVAFVIAESLFLVPFLLSAGAVTCYLQVPEKAPRAVTPSAVLTALGIVFVGLGLVGYGHGTPMFLLFAFISQIIVGVWALVAAKRNT